MRNGNGTADRKNLHVNKQSRRKQSFYDITWLVPVRPVEADAKGRPGPSTCTGLCSSENSCEDSRIIAAWRCPVALRGWRRWKSRNPGIQGLSGPDDPQRYGLGVANFKIQAKRSDFACRPAEKVRSSARKVRFYLELTCLRSASVSMLIRCSASPARVLAMHCGAALHRAGNGESSEEGEFRSLAGKC